MGEPMPSRPFDAMEDNPFLRFINCDDREVTYLIDRVRSRLDSCGEYDQDDTAVMEWDILRDLVTIAEKLWEYRNAQRGT